MVGSRQVYITGCLLLTGFVLGSGLAQTSTQLIAFRAGQGVAASMCLPTALSLLASSLPVGKRRNVGFAFAGASQPIGYSIGLFLGGFFVDSIGWRYGWYMSAIASFIVFLAAIFGIPKPVGASSSSPILKRLVYEIDWVGAILASACLGMLSYVLA
jgi:MFS family permease